MFILHDILKPLQNEFSSSRLGSHRSRWFVYALLSFIIPFTSSISSNILRCMQAFFGIDINKRRFYTFMASTKLPRDKLWSKLWYTIPKPLTDGRLIVAISALLLNLYHKKQENYAAIPKRFSVEAANNALKAFVNFIPLIVI